jgi:hypothetical protein
VLQLVQQGVPPALQGSPPARHDGGVGVGGVGGGVSCSVGGVGGGVSCSVGRVGCGVSDCTGGGVGGGVCVGPESPAHAHDVVVDSLDSHVQ